MKPLAIDLYAGLGGWADGLLAAGYRVIGFDLERHVYGEHRYPAQLVLQDVRTLDGRKFRDASLIVASPPCQRYSWMAMPWKAAKAKAAWYEQPGHPERLADLNELWDACWRIQREASAAAGRHIPMVVENVLGAQRWVGKARWHFGSYYLWGDVPALMPSALRLGVKVPGLDWSSQDKAKRRCFRDEGIKVGDRNAHRATGGHKWSAHWTENDAIKNTGGSWFNVAHNTTSGKGRNPYGRCGWFGADHPSPMRKHSSGSQRRKAASALIAKIPFRLAHWIGRAWLPPEAKEAAS